VNTNTDTQTDWNTVVMGSGSMKYSCIPSFVKIGAAIQNFMERIHRHIGSVMIL
jgi:hypothetical protein